MKVQKLKQRNPNPELIPFTQLKGSHLRIALLIRLQVCSFDRYITSRTSRGIFEMNLPAQRVSY
jgi:hypothetical protein